MANLKFRFILSAALVFAAPVFAAAARYTAPRAGGGSNYHSERGNGYSTPRAGGGYDYHYSNGNSAYSTPRAGGGYNYHYGH